MLSRYSDLINHALAGVMFHCDGVDYFCFLSCANDAKEQKEHAKEEFAHYLKLKRRYIDKFNSLPMEVNASSKKKVVPDDWRKYNRFDVTQQVRAKAKADFFEMWLAWEKETLEMLNKAITDFETNYKPLEADFLRVWACDVEKEIETVQKHILEG